MKFDAVPTIADALETTLLAFRAGDFDRAETEAEAALALDFEDPGVQSALKCAVYWKDRMARSVALGAPEDRGDQLLKEWQGFDQRFRLHLDQPFDAPVAAIKAAVFEKAAEFFLEQVPFEGEEKRFALLLKAARAQKVSGAFETALATLDQVLQLRPDDAGALAQMADCFEAVGDTQRSRLFFREAFYINPQAIDVDALDSGVIGGLVSSLREQGLNGSELREWLPVHAVVGGVFSVKRDLKPLELGQLRQGINSLKSEYHGGNAGPMVLPRLLNRYFWLIDHFFSVKEDRSKIEDVLLNIKLLDQKIYELYTH